MCGIGIPGELCIAGDGLARGYLNRPELTAEKFIDNPFGEGKLYRSGDLARWLPDGNIEYLGRIDEQVKIRGFRIELGEIENSIRSIASVKDCAVIAREDASGDKAIYAYIVSDEKVSVSEIRDTLGQTLPEYMIPAYMMQIESIPVTRNGKLDRKALPEIESRSEKEYVAPRNETEEIICEVFSEILGVGKVGVKDSFFELGGHSLRATRLVNQIEAKTGHRIALKDVFSNPSVEKLAALVTGSVAEEYIPIPKAEEKEYYPMSSTQKRTYLICQMDSNGIAYNMPQNMKLTGEVRPEGIKAALEKMIERHEILRTAFLMVDGEPVQQILERAEADYEYIEDAETSEEELMRSFVRPFDLSKAPMVRAKLVKRGSEYLLMMDMHHIVGDGMSMGTFTREFAALYNGEELVPLTHQYKDYSEWMRTRDISAQKEYWVEQFNDEIPVLDMPLDYSRPQEQSYKGAMLFKSTGKELGKRIKELTAKTGTTEYMVFLSAAMVLLSKYSRQEDIVIGSPISGRTHKDTEGMLGMFVNTLAMRGKPEGQKSYAEFLAEIKEVCLKAYENQEYPFEELVEAVDVRRDMSRNPLFDVMVVMQNNEQAEMKLSGTNLEMTGVDSTIAKFDMTFNVVEGESDFGVALEYCSDLFKEESAMRILSHYIEVLKQITTNTEKKLSEVEAVTEEEREQILGKFNDTAAEYPKNKTVVELFEEQVAKTPNNVAVVYEGTELTYAELNAKANQLGRKLRECGVKPDDFVAIMAERSLEMIVGIYGILKAGGAYVPIDPTYPEDRKQFMIEDCTPKAVLVYGAEIETDVPVIDLAKSEVWEGASENLELVNKPSDLVYCIYTSGTTGKPKGVMIEHHGVVAMNKYLVDLYKVNCDDNVLQFANYIFDASVWEMTIALLNGAKLVLVDSETISDISKFDEFAKQERISITLLPPQYYIQSNISGLKVLTTGGSASNPAIVEKSADNRRYINAYGPTENTVLATHWESQGSDATNVIPIGRPIKNTQIYILNGLQLCGIGIPGELCIAGDGLARGYLNRPELTAEKFIDNPYGEGKLYRSGDLARWLPDGNIEYLGRIDEQVKIRGFRIELGEIENSIRKIEAVKDCAVIAREDASGDKAIYAYIVSDEKVSVSEIRDTLGQTLPEYMIPAYMMQIESIPVTRNGKLDRKALPEIESRSEKEYVAPKNETEEIICEVFGEILGVEKVGVKDSFFELGGDSIKAIRVVSKTRERGYELTVKDIMSRYTPEALSVCAVPIGINEYEQGEVTGTVVTTPIIREFQKWNFKEPHHFNQAVMIPVEDDEQVLKKALDAIVKHHDVLRSVYIDGHLEIKGYNESKKYDFYQFDMTGKNNVAEQVESECSKIQAGIDLENGPLMKVALFVTDEGRQMMICLHHLVVDGVSWRILLEDLNTALSQIRESQAVVLPQKAASFKDWAEALEEYRHSSMLKKEEKYWADIDAQLPSCVFDCKDKNDSCEVSVYRSELSEDDTRKLLHDVGKAYNTQINDILLAALGMAVHDVTGQNKVAVSLEAHGRESIHKKLDIDRTVGWFTTVYPVILNCTDSIEDSIIDTKEMLRKVPNQGIGYSLLSNNGVSADICFNYLGEMDAESSENSTNFSVGCTSSYANGIIGEFVINLYIHAEALHIEVMSRNSSYEVTCELVLTYIEKLIKIISQCYNTSESIMTSTDLAVEDLSSDDIDLINSLLG